MFTLFKNILGDIYLSLMVPGRLYDRFYAGESEAIIAGDTGGQRAA